MAALHEGVDRFLPRELEEIQVVETKGFRLLHEIDHHERVGLEQQDRQLARNHLAKLQEPFGSRNALYGLAEDRRAFLGRHSQAQGAYADQRRDRPVDFRRRRSLLGLARAHSAAFFRGRFSERGFGVLPALAAASERRAQAAISSGSSSARSGARRYDVMTWRPVFVS